MWRLGRRWEDDIKMGLKKIFDDVYLIDLAG
jgi:hypothetical protein